MKKSLLYQCALTTVLALAVSLACGAAAFGQGRTYKWFTHSDNASEEIIRDLQVDSGGSSYFVGTMSATGPSTLGGFTRTSFGGTDGVVARVDKWGTVLWYFNFGSSQDDSPQLFLEPTTGISYVTGVTNTSVTYRGVTTSLPLGEIQGIYLLKIDKNGNLLTSAILATGSVTPASKRPIWADAAGNITFGGQGTGIAFFRGSSVNLGTHRTIFVARYNPTLASVWQRQSRGRVESLFCGACVPRADLHSVIQDVFGNVIIHGTHFGAIRMPKAATGDSLYLEGTPGSLNGTSNAAFYMKLSSLGWAGTAGNLYAYAKPAGLDVAHNGAVAIATTVGFGGVLAVGRSGLWYFLPNADPATMELDWQVDPTNSSTSAFGAYGAIYSISISSLGQVFVASDRIRNPDSIPGATVRKVVQVYVDGFRNSHDSIAVPDTLIHIDTYHAASHVLASNFKASSVYLYPNTYTNGFPDSDFFLSRNGYPPPTLTSVDTIVLGKPSSPYFKMGGTNLFNWTRVRVNGRDAEGFYYNFIIPGIQVLGAYPPEGIPLGPVTVQVNTTEGSATINTVVVERSNWDWMRRVTGPSFDRMNKAAYDRFQNTYSVGSFVGQTDVDITASTHLTHTAFSPGTRQALINKYNSSGQLLWSLNAASSGPINPEAEAWDCAMHQDSLFVVGYFKGTIAFSSIGGPSRTLVSAGGKDIFLVKYSPTGQCLWALRFGGTSDDEAWDVNVSRTGKTYIAGNFSNTITFSGRPGATGGIAPLSKTSAGGLDAFLVKFMVNGALEWGISLGGPGNDIAYGIQQSPSQEAYFCGQFQNTALLTPTSGGIWSLTSAGGSDGFVGQMGTGGTVRWLRRMGGTGDDVCRQIAVDQAANNCIVGYFNSPLMTVQAGASPVINAAATLSTAGSTDAFAVSYTGPTGLFRYARRFGGTLADEGRSITVDRNGFFLMTGFFASTANDGVAIQHSSANNSSDLFLWQLYPSGNSYMVTRSGGNNSEQGRGVDTAAAGGVTVVGQYGHNSYFGTFGPFVETGSGGGFTAKFGGTLAPGFRLGDESDVVLGSDEALVRLYPNPATRSLTVMVQGEGLTSGCILDAQGRQVEAFKTRQGLNLIDVSGLPSGLYRIIVKDESGKLLNASFVKE